MADYRPTLYGKPTVKDGERRATAAVLYKYNIIHTRPANYNRLGYRSCNRKQSSKANSLNPYYMQYNYCNYRLNFSL